MTDSKPKVFPMVQPKAEDKGQIRTDRLADTPEHNVSVDSDYDIKKVQVAEEIYTNTAQALLSTNTNLPMVDAIEMMRRRTEEQLKIRDERIAEMKGKTQEYEKKYEEVKQNKQVYKYEPETRVLSSEPKSIINNVNQIKMSDTNSYIQQLSQPQFNAAFDLLPLPSEGKLYKTKKPSVKVAYMTTADENILTSPNLLQSGQFLEILINRKLLETNIRYRDLHVGDRNAIMLWLRATAFGEMYPVTVFDEDGNPFDTEIDLSTLKVKNLGAEPDDEGLFPYLLPVSKTQIKFKLLTVGDIEDIENMIDSDEKNELLVNNTSTYKLQKQIVEVNGDRNPMSINQFIDNMRIRDAKELREYIDKIDSGVDLEVEIRTPRGGFIKTFLPLSLKFFWPDITI